MAKFVSKIINILCLMGSVAWLSSTHDWEPLVATITFFGAFLGLEIADLKKSKKLCETDRSLFQTLQKDLPHNSPGIIFLKEQDIGAPFRSNNLNDLYGFLRKWGNATHEFNDKKINKKLSEFYSLLDEFTDKLSLKVYAAKNPEFLTMDLEDFETRPEKFLSRDELNEMAHKVYGKYEELINEIRKNL
jgi:hypothetical protein